MPDRPVRKRLALSNGAGTVLIFEPAADKEKNTAVILHPDGTLRKEIVIPPQAGPYLSIDDVYYEGGRLAFILTTRRTYDVACLFDDDGNYVGHHFTK